MREAARDYEADRPTPLWEDFGQFVHERCNAAFIFGHMTIFEIAFGQFVHERCNAAHREALRNNATYRKARRELSKQHDQLWNQIVKKVDPKLLDELESVVAREGGLEAEAAYVQGLRDGLKLARALDRLDWKIVCGKEEAEEEADDGSEKAV
jgi:hypothetical protein